MSLRDLRLLVFAVMGLFLLSLSARADTLYSDGGISGTTESAQITTGTISDSFVLGSASTITDISNLGVWVYNNSTLTSVDWSITTAPDGGTVELSGSGPTSSTLFSTPGNWDVYNTSFAVTDLAPLSAGTYYLNLFDGAAAPYDLVGWDINDGPSSVYLNGTLDSAIPAESFEIDGTVATSTAAPEPSVILMLALGLLTLAGMCGMIRPAKSRPHEA